jgi:hypothetical protein
MALQTFLMKNNRLPCPADPNIDTYLGDEKCPSTPILRGVIPGRALGLSGGRLLDAWDRQFTYTVVLDATKPDSFTKYRWPPTFELKDEHGIPLNKQNKGIVVIISHGANGSGAYTTKGEPLPSPVTTAKFELENLDDDPTFVQAAYSTHEENPFDDQVLVLTEDQIVQPLANQGALKTKQAQAWERLKRIENALIGFIVANARKCGPLEIPIPPSSAGDTVPNDLSLKGEYVLDPWGGGKGIIYKVDGTPNHHDCFAMTDKITVTLKSRGPPDKVPNDDIIVTKSTLELGGILTAAGIDIDGPSDSSSSSQPITKDSKNGPP